MIARLEDLRKGDLVLYISRAKATQAENEKRFPIPILNVFHSTGNSMGGKRVLKFYLDDSHGLLPDKIVVNGEERARISLTSWNGRAVYDMLAELRAGKTAVLDYLETRPDLALHKPWITSLREPFYDNFPQLTKISVI